LIRAIRGNKSVIFMPIVAT